MIYVLIDQDTGKARSEVLGVFESHSVAQEHKEWYAAHKEDEVRTGWNNTYSRFIENEVDGHHYAFPVAHWNSFDQFDIVAKEVTA
jgi:hypothetical protein